MECMSREYNSRPSHRTLAREKVRRRFGKTVSPPSTRSLNKPQLHASDYRRDIDGLRAIAVLSVIGFHAGWSWLKGGFVGVDIFFVISGYLISGLIFRALERNKFSAKEFYARRINRIFPALIVVLVFCLIAGWVILMPIEYQSLGKHTFGGSAFISNVLLWREAGYFDSPDKPLLHLWSLAIEEQFYLLWPAIAVIAWRLKWSITATLVAIVAISFASNLWQVAHGNTTAAFYFPGARFWEILAGALLANLESRRIAAAGTTNSSARLREAAAVIGLALLVVTTASVESTTPWPGWWGLGPVAAAALLIGAGPDTWVNKRVLGSAILVWIGLISYPLYLWHWPLMVGARLTNGDPVSTAAMIAIIAATILLAWLTYKIVEIPIRVGAHKRRSAMILFPALIFTGLAGIAINRGLLQPRLFAASIALDKARRDWIIPSNGGLTSFGGDLVVDSLKGTTTDAVVFIGDSHAQQYWPRVVELSKNSASFPTAIFLAYGSCVPMPNLERRAGNSPVTGKPFECDRFHKLAMDIIRQPRVRAVALAANWEDYITNNATFLTTDNSGVPLSTTGERTDSAFRMFASELKSLTTAGKQVFIILSNPELKAFDPVTMLPSRLPGVNTKPPRLFVTRDEVLAKTGAVTERLRTVASESGARVLDPLEVLCKGARCPTVWSNGVPVYIDNSHMSASFVRSRASFVDSVFAKVK